MTRFQLAEHQGTRLWSGDVIVVGGTLGGLAAALAAAADGCRVCLLEPGPTLGTELSAEWDNDLPEHQVVSRLRTLVGQAGAPVEGPVDIVLGALACDQVVEEGSVDAFVKVIPARLLRDGDGRLEGVETVGKSGRQAVSAPVVIDATRDQRLARRELGLDPAVSEQVVRRLYVANLELPEEGACWTVPDSLGLAANRVQGRPGAWPGEALLEVVMRRGSATLSELMLNTLQAATDSFSWLRQNEPAFETATLVEVAPDFAERGVSRETLDVPEGTGLLVLERCEDVGSRLASGHAVGKGIGTPQRALPEAASAASADETVLKTAELSASEDQDFSAMTLPPVLAQGHHPRDVVVAGYGTGGAFAALAAAEEGVEVAVLDPSPIPGGIGSAGRIHSYYHGLKGGLQDRLDEQVTGQGSALGPKVRGYQPVARAAVLAGAMGDRQGLDIYAGHTVFGVVRESGRITGVVSVAADGYHVFPCTVAVDGTGDGDVAAAAGAPTTLGREGDGFPQPYSYTPTSVNGTELRHHNFDAGWVDPTDTADFSRAHFEGRRAIRERGPFSPETHFCSLATILGLRESRFLEGRLTLTFEDFLNGKTFPDTVCSAYAHHDNHAMDYAEESEWSRRHVVMFGLWRYLCHGDIPYRALLPQEVDGLLMACRALSVDHDLHQLVRMQRDMQVIGEICGVAAAESVKRGTPPADLPVDDLQRLLKRRGIEPRPAEKALDLPVPELFGKLGEDGQERGLAMWRLSSLTDTEAWEQFFRNEDDPHARFCGAVAALLAGQKLEAAVTTLRRAIEERVAEPTLGVKSPARYLVAALALAQARVDGIAETIGEILASETFSAADVLLLLKGLEQAGQAQGVPAIKRFLQDNEDENFAVPLWGADPDHPTSFRPQVDIRAVQSLAALGCADQAHRLVPYLHHPVLLIRRHARNVLRSIRTLSPRPRHWPESHA